MLPSDHDTPSEKMPRGSVFYHEYADCFGAQSVPAPGLHSGFPWTKVLSAAETLRGLSGREEITMWSASLAVAGGVMGLALALPLAAAEPQIHKGTVVSASGGRLVLKDMAGKEQSFTADAMTRITVHGKPGKLEDLQETMPVQVATEATGKVLTIATIDKDKRKDPRPAPVVSKRSLPGISEAA
jgi:hypothetical protein